MNSDKKPNRIAGFSFSATDGWFAALSVIPSIILILSGNVAIGLALAIGTLPTLQFGISPKRKQRITYSLLGTIFGLAIFVGSFIGKINNDFIIAGIVFAVAYLAALGASRKPAGIIMLALILPALTVGISYDSQSAFNVFLAFVAGSLWAGFVLLFWRESNEKISQAGMKVFVAKEPKQYGLLLGLAASIALLYGFRFDPQFSGWAATATLLIMRPIGGMVKSRGTWRAIATVLGSVLAVFTIQLVIPNFLIAIIVLVSMVIAFGTLKSGWWLVPLCTAYFILSLNLIDETSVAVIRESGWQRIADNLVGAGIALIFGLLIPTLISKYRNPKAVLNN